MILHLQKGHSVFRFFCFNVFATQLCSCSIHMWESTKRVSGKVNTVKTLNLSFHFHFLMSLVVKTRPSWMFIMTLTTKNDNKDDCWCQPEQRVPEHYQSLEMWLLLWRNIRSAQVWWPSALRHKVVKSYYHGWHFCCGPFLDPPLSLAPDGKGLG